MKLREAKSRGVRFVGARVGGGDAGKEGDKPTPEDLQIYELTKRPHLTLEELLPSPLEWHQRWHVRSRKRLLLLRALSYTLAAVNLGHLLLLFAFLVYALSVDNWIAAHTLPATEKRHTGDAVFYETDCVAIYPECTGPDDWCTLDFLPYASLPRKRAVFAMSSHIRTFQECYNAYWLGVHPSKRRFVDGQLRFLGKRADLSCLQVGRTGVIETATVANCLTVSFQFRLRNAMGLSGLRNWGASPPPKPTVAYVGGHGLLQHRPRLIPLDIVSQLDVFYVVIRYRLGVFGFGDFGTPDYGSNHGVDDVRKALEWLHENARRFGGSDRDLTLIGEDSGASIALAVSRDRFGSDEGGNLTRPYLVSKLWLHEGSVVVPEIASEERPFHLLILKDAGLASACQRWQRQNPDRGSGSGSSTMARRITCLEESVDETAWLERTPGVWLGAGQRMSFLPRREEESTASLLVADPQVSRVVSPLEATSLARNLPLVWFSSLNHPSPPAPQALTSNGFRNMVQKTFAEFTAANTRHNYAEEILKAYEPMLKAVSLNTSKTRYAPIINAMIVDLRAVCGVDLYLSRLMRLSATQREPVYRILSEVEWPRMEEKAVGRYYDMPAFLSGNHQWRQRHLTKFLREAFVSFVKFGTVKTIKRLRYPRSPEDPDLETTFNVLGPAGLTTATSRVISHFAACKAWLSGKDETEFAIKYGCLN